MANGNPAPYAQNAFNAAVKPIDFSKPGAPSVQMYHGGTIIVNENIIGRINSWQASGAYTREGTHIYEVNSNTWGVPVDYVPGRVTGFNITFTRNEVWSQELEIALGYGAVWNDLTDQTYPFTAKEMLFKGSSPYKIWSYFGCWFTEKNPAEWSNEGNGIISVSCGMAYVSRKKTS